MTYISRPAHQRNEVLRLHRLHPEWSGKEITFAMGASFASIRSVVSRRKLALPSFFERRKITGPLKVRP